jgi:hypothetical protein
MVDPLALQAEMALLVVAVEAVTWLSPQPVGAESLDREITRPVLAGRQMILTVIPLVVVARAAYHRTFNRVEITLEQAPLLPMVAPESSMQLLV